LVPDGADPRRFNSLLQIKAAPLRSAAGALVTRALRWGRPPGHGRADAGQQPQISPAQ
jgi:hypothetical protein